MGLLRLDDIQRSNVSWRVFVALDAYNDAL
jgi:hypothetical protein